ncbi:glycosyltransferase [Deinococcus roseus]|uniref:Glycosyl transferase n=1 Tax=Deinococcus roseus TaxID=392414 RepID=A0ABQ2CYJ6_9DEIO|nr:nucleotide disphospho-sugar-binding domain-containing protein [Deinococcus roseus]GGJ22332.1 glycosyl transferase [Deinococcus roseus]
MTRFLVATMPIPGHIAPFAPVVRALIARGHQVAWYGSRFHQDKIEATGATFYPIQNALDFGDSDYNKHFPERTRYSGLKQVVFDFKHLFVGSAEGQVKDLRHVISDFKAEVLLSDPAVVAGLVLGNEGFPHAMLDISVLSFESKDLAAFGLGLLPDSSFFGRIRNKITYWMVDHVVFREVNQAYRNIAQKNGWQYAPFRPTPSRYLTLQPTTPEFEYPVSDLPDTVHFIGPLLPDRPRAFTPPIWWNEVVNKTRPVVLVTQGTIATHADELIQPTLEGLASEDVLVIATTGGPSLSFPVPQNARVEAFVPFTELMPHVDVFVTNGGYGGITIALANGVPVVSAGTTEDKMEVSNRVQFSGVGLNLKTNRPRPEQVRQAIQQVLQGSYGQQAKKIQKAFAATRSAETAVELLEELARTGKPVLNSRAAGTLSRKTAIQ